ncbi:MAG TPA: sigma-70 family RNA polymerase sigma factor [Ktedonobacterales bacterium]|jgi:RNA polymerase sigma-70 factor (ECF subfamily)|nr:sigma-70 family RNA polymerase sigma factor [Ktedonobacterales bacterium]
MLARIGAGDRQALAELYQRHSRSLFQYLLRLTPDQGLAEEILQDTFVAVWHSAARFAGRSAARTWLIGIARRQAHNRLRRHEPDRANAAELASLAAPDPGPENAVLLRATRDELIAAIGRLSFVHREALALAIDQGLTSEEIAGVLHIPVGTAKSRLRDAKRALRALLRSEEEVP